jgi:hypothetical protein
VRVLFLGVVPYGAKILARAGFVPYGTFCAMRYTPVDSREGVITLSLSAQPISAPTLPSYGFPFSKSTGGQCLQNLIGDSECAHRKMKPVQCRRHNRKSIFEVSWNVFFAKCAWNTHKNAVLIFHFSFKVLKPSNLSILSKTSQ